MPLPLPVAEEVQNNEPGMSPLLGGRKGRLLVDRLALSIVVFFASTWRPTKNHVHVASQHLLHTATEQALPRHAKLE